MQLDLTGRRVLVTGGSRGIGLACARGFLAEGATVAIAGRNPETLERLRAELPGISTHSADLADAAQAEAMLDEVEAAIGPLDIVVNSAGAAKRTQPEDLSAEAWRAAMDAKFFACIHVADPAARRMAKRGSGVVINIIGVGGRVAAPHHLPGGSANAALMLATAGMGSAWASSGVRVVGVSPGPTRTDRLVGLLEIEAKRTGIDLAQAEARSVARIPMGRLADPEDIAQAVMFFASPRASYITGVTLTMDGGAVPIVM